MVREFKTMTKKIEESMKGITSDYKPPEKITYGQFTKVEYTTYLDIHEFCPTTNCNVFHGDDMAEVLYNLRVPFELNWIMDEGRNHASQITIKNKWIIYITASGYGIGEGISFSKRFPEELKFNILRAMSLTTINDSKKYYGEYKKKIGKFEKTKINELNAIRDTMYDYVCNVKTLKQVTRMYHILQRNNFYKKLKVADFKRFPDWKETAHNVQQEYEVLLKTRYYNIFVEHLKKINTEGK